jgi:hypothetical protein
MQSVYVVYVYIKTEESAGSYLEPNKIRIRVASDATLDVDGTTGRDAHSTWLTKRLLGETQSLDQ